MLECSNISAFWSFKGTVKPQKGTVKLQKSAVGANKGTDSRGDLEGRPVLNSVSLSVKPGEILCLTGPNGSGKSTLMKILAGVSGPDLKYTGTVSVDGDSLESFSRKDLAQIMAYMAQNESSAWNYKVRDVVLTGRFCHTKNSGFYSKQDFMVTDEMLERVHITHLADRNVFELSGGEFQKVRIARCLAQEPKYLVLDEPVANLDFSYENEILALLKEQAREKQMGILVSIHDLNTACRFADKMALLPRQKPCFMGTVNEVMVTEKLKEAYDGQEFGTFTHPSYGCIQVYTK